MPATRFFEDNHGPRLARILKAVRKSRVMTAADVSTQIGIPKRSYEHFESGEPKFDFAKVVAFAEATDADPAAILLAMLINSETFATGSMSNKAGTVVLVALERFILNIGDDLAQLDTATILAELTDAFRRLAETPKRSKGLLAATRVTDEDKP